MAPPSTPDKWPPPTAYDEIISIISGKQDVKTYSIHKGVLVFYSSYFEKEIDGRLQEAESKEVKLPDAEPEVFDAVQSWLYSHRLHPDIDQDSNKIPWNLAPKIWVFADKHGMPALQNSVVDFMHKRSVQQWVVPIAQSQYIYQATMPNACLRRWIIDFIAEVSSGKALLIDHNGGEHLSKEAACDLLKIVWDSNHRIKTKAEVEQWDMCKYHIHEPGARCVNKSVKM